MKAKNMIKIATVATSFVALQIRAIDVTDVTMSQEIASRHVTITYVLEGGPAVVTLDVQTNCVIGTSTNWASIGGNALWNAQGDVWKQVDSGAKTITWHPSDTWPDHIVSERGARAVVTAWAANNTPNYMVVDLTDASAGDRVRYYPAADFLPKAGYESAGDSVVDNPLYKTTKLVMRKIMARGVEWTMGSEATELGRTGSETTHYAKLDGNYYIGVFEITQYQWALIATNSSTTAQYLTDGAMRPMTGVCYNEIRNTNDSNIANATYNWPADPAPGSFLGLLRTKTLMDFDLPSEAQWEFAARSGHGSGYWNDGSAILSQFAEDTNLSRIARYKDDGGYLDGEEADASCGPTNGTAIVGAYAPNGWGLYDMHGNAGEWCLDFYEANIATTMDVSGKLYAGRLNINPGNSAQTLSGSAGGNNRVGRSGSYLETANKCRSAYRVKLGANNRYKYMGLRVVCTTPLQ